MDSQIGVRAHNSRPRRTGPTNRLNINGLKEEGLIMATGGIVCDMLEGRREEYTNTCVQSKRSGWYNTDKDICVVMWSLI